MIGCLTNFFNFLVSETIFSSFSSSSSSLCVCVCGHSLRSHFCPHRRSSRLDSFPFLCVVAIVAVPSAVKSQSVAPGP